MLYRNILLIYACFSWNIKFQEQAKELRDGVYVKFEAYNMQTQTWMVSWECGGMYFHVLNTLR